MLEPRNKYRGQIAGILVLTLSNLRLQCQNLVKTALRILVKQNDLENATVVQVRDPAHVHCHLSQRDVFFLFQVGRLMLGLIIPPEYLDFFPAINILGWIRRTVGVYDRWMMFLMIYSDGGRVEATALAATRPMLCSGNTIR